MNTQISVFDFYEEDEYDEHTHIPWRSFDFWKKKKDEHTHIEHTSIMYENGTRIRSEHDFCSKTHIVQENTHTIFVQ